LPRSALLAALLLAAPAAAQGLPEGFTTEARLEADAATNTRGGLASGPAAIARGFGALDFAAAGWTTRASVFAIWGRQLTPTRLGSFAPSSSLEATSTLRLFELWAERDLGFGSLRFGQLAADEEIAITWANAQLVSGTFGWFTGLAGALPSGGPAYPLAALGARLALGDPDGTAPEGGATRAGLRIALFAGDPGGRYGEATDPQRHNRYGTTFSTRGGALWIAEAVLGAPAEADEPRAWAVRLGAFHHTGRFEDPRFDRAGLPLADPASDGVPRERRGNQGVFGGAEAAWDAAGGRQLVASLRAAWFPENRNEIAGYADAALALRGAFLADRADTLMLGVAYSGVGRSARDAARDAGEPRRHAEWLVELGWRAPLPGLDGATAQPFLQWIRDPSGNAAQERLDGRAARDALVVGLRLAVTL
jgi:porin